MSVETEVKEPKDMREALNMAFEETVKEAEQADSKTSAVTDNTQQTGTDKSGEKPTVQEAKPSAPANESTPTPPESAVPEWAKTLNLEDSDTVEAINHFMGAEAAEWTRTPTNKMDPAKLEKFKKVQSNYEKDRVAQRKAEEQKEDPFASVKRLADRINGSPALRDKFARFNEELGRDEDTTKTSPAKTEQKNYKKVLSESAQEGNWDAFNDTIDAMLGERLAKVVESTEKRTLQQVEARESERIQKSYIEGISRTSEALRKQEGERYEQFVQPDTTGESPLARILRIGVDPITGERITTGNPEQDLVNAYSYLLSRSRGQAPKLKPVLHAEPTPKQSTGAEPDLTDEEMNLPLKEVLRRKHQQTLK